MAIGALIVAIAVVAWIVWPTPSSHRPRFTRVASVPHCTTFSGTGKIPAGEHLVIFDQDAFSDGTPKPYADYSYDGPASQAPDGTGWTAERLGVGSGHGDAGDRKVVLAVLLPRRSFDRLAHTDPGALPDLPAGADVADTMVVERNSENAHC